MSPLVEKSSTTQYCIMMGALASLTYQNPKVVPEELET